MRGGDGGKDGGVRRDLLLLPVRGDRSADPDGGEAAGGDLQEGDAAAKQAEGEAEDEEGGGVGGIDGGGRRRGEEGHRWRWWEQWAHERGDGTGEVAVGGGEGEGGGDVGPVPMRRVLAEPVAERKVIDHSLIINWFIYNLF